MITVSGVSKRYGTQLLFEDMSFAVNRGERIGLVGRNGHGKSTLFRMITSLEACDEGKILVPNGYRIGYLPQEVSFTCPTVIEECCTVLDGDMENHKWKAEKVLSGLGFGLEDMSRPCSEFSGGYQVRIELAKVLVSSPDMLLLDEPTNFLDVVSIRWLESFLREWRGEFIVISHDRGFMDSVVTHVVGIHRQKARKIKGVTADYYSQIEQEEAVHEKNRVNAEKKRKQVMGYISSFRAKARHARSVQSSIKMLNKMGIPDRLDGIKGLSFSFSEAELPARYVLDVRDLGFSYSGEPPYLFEGLTFQVAKDDKICVIGKNGKGKTTLMKVMNGVLEPVLGRVKEHPRAAKAYFEQGNTAVLGENNTVEEELSTACAGSMKGNVRDICGVMMFQGDDALKKISVLSGGEKSRVLLGKTLLMPANLLMLDEPTHHLDIESCQSIIEAVKNFRGAAVVVTHDENFIRCVASKLIVFQSGRVLFFPGTYDEFLDQVGWDEESCAGKGGGALRKEDKKNKKELRKMRADNARKIRPYEERVKGLESGIESAEKEIAFMTREMIRASEEGDAGKIAEIPRRINEIRSREESLYSELEAALEELENARKEIDEG
ncbi:MAG: ATP-binding cassette domain-containing protein [Candidatus Omnitrophica bacterium]|nr:ATP-binding cassette domain-containing protein [Candidatus Omnitrophota bacterium]MDD5488263.1 ATP-binding cassette domain-containing protein [Candidatus Omnitrophota bacterium]